MDNFNNGGLAKDAVRRKKLMLAKLWLSFNTIFPDDNDCRMALFSGSFGTLFTFVRKPRVWLFCIWLMEQGIEFNAHDLHELTNISYSTASKVFLKICMCVEQIMGTEPLATTVNSREFQDNITRRSLETAANEHPRTEQDDVEKQFNDQGEKYDSTTNYRASQTDEDSLDEMSRTTPDQSHDTPTGLTVTEEKIIASLSTIPKHFNDICVECNIDAGRLSSALVNLELAGLIKPPSGEYYTKNFSRNTKQDTTNRNQKQPRTENAKESKRKNSRLIELALNKISSFIRRSSQGVSRKRLQQYIVADWIFSRAKKILKTGLLDYCRNSQHISDEDLRNYVTPLHVKIVAAV